MPQSDPMISVDLRAGGPEQPDSSRAMERSRVVSSFMVSDGVGERRPGDSTRSARSASGGSAGEVPVGGADARANHCTGAGGMQP